MRPGIDAGFYSFFFFSFFQSSSSVILEPWEEVCNIGVPFRIEQCFNSFIVSNSLHVGELWDFVFI